MKKVFLLFLKKLLNSIFKFNKTKTDKIMFNYIGGQDVPQTASEGMADIPLNRTFFVQKLTNDDAIKPEAVYDLKTVEEVFSHYKPNVDVEFQDADGNTSSENISYSNVGDFSASNLSKNSPFLFDLKIQQEQFQKILKQAKNNKVLGKVLENPEAKAAFLSLINSLVNEIDSVEQ